MSSFAAKILQSRALVYDIRWFKDGEERFMIIDVDKERHQEFRDALEYKHNVNLKTFGKILFMDYGQPSEAIKAECREKYKMYMDE